MKVSNYTSYLSQLIYNSQPVVLQHCLDRVEAGEPADMSGCIVADIFMLPHPASSLFGDFQSLMYIISPPYN